MAPDRLDDEEFASETRIMDLGQPTTHPPDILRRMPRSDPLPAIIQMIFRVRRGPGAGRVTAMTKPIVMLGRVADIADVAVEDRAASRYHASVTHQAGRFILTDMGSTNGTFVNGARVNEIELKSGDEIHIGATTVSFEIAPR